MSSKKPRVLSRIRKQKGYTQESLAEALGVDAQTVRSWERGAHAPGIGKQKELVDLLGVSWEELNDELQSSDQGPGTDEIGAPGQGKHPVQPWSIPRPRDENRQRMLRRVQSRWITGVLGHVSNMPLIALNMRMRPDATASPWLTDMHDTPVVETFLLPDGTSILDVYNDADGELLILGAPGAGKSTLLLELTRTLVEQAKLDESHPIPVIFQLTSWAEQRRDLVDWLASELHQKYQVPFPLAQAWLSNDQVLPLLDGLDEVNFPARSACIDAITHYRQAHGLVPIVVCCRTEDYEALPQRLLLARAVEVLPLTFQQIDAYVSVRGQELETLHVALHADPLLQEMASTPLMLSVLALTYADFSVEDMLALATQEERRRLVFDQYVTRVVQRRDRGSGEAYSLPQIRQWLAWLAHNLVRQNQSEFYVERLQPTWLQRAAQRYRYRVSVIRMVFSIESIVIVGLFAWVRGGRIGDVSGVGAGLLGWLGGGPGNSLLGWMAPGLGAGLEGGGILGLVLGMVNLLQVILIGVSMSFNLKGRELPWPWNRRSLLAALASGLNGVLVVGALSAVVFVLLGMHIYGMTLWAALSFALMHAVSYSLFSGLIIGLHRGLLVGLLPRGKQEAMHMKRGDRLITGLVIALWTWLSFGVINSLLVGPLQGIPYGAILAGLFFLVFGPARGTEMIPGLGMEIVPSETVTWSWQSVKENLKGRAIQGFTIGFSIIPAVILVLGVASAFFQGPAYGIRYGLVYGPIMGLIVSISSWLAGVLNGGWSSDLLSERQLNRPNEGIRRSVYNSLISGAIFGPIGGLASGAVIGLAFGMVGQLPGWPILSVGFAIVFTLIFAVNFALMRGGIAVLEHYLLRWYLWRGYRIPLHLIHFLDFAVERILLRKVGGGYMFIHRLLLEHFASLNEDELIRP